MEIKNQGIFDLVNLDGLYEKTMDRLKGKDLYVKDTYLFEKTIYGEVLTLYGLYFSKSQPKEIENIYYQYLLETNRFLGHYLILTGSFDYFEKEVVTGIALPRISLSSEVSLFLEKIRASLYFQNNLFSYDINSTNFFVYGNGRKATDEEIENYVKTFCQKENYMELLNMLIVYLEGTQFSFADPIPSYIPDELIPYYRELGRECNLREEFHKIISTSSGIEYPRFSNDKLIRTLRKED